MEQFRPPHDNNSDCVALRGFTVGDSVAGYAADFIATFCNNREDASAIRDLVRDYFATNPQSKGTIESYTPRGRKRRGLTDKRRGPRLTLVLGDTRYYYPVVPRRFTYARAAVTLFADKATVHCNCPGVNRAVVPLNTVLWPVTA